MSIKYQVREKKILFTFSKLFLFVDKYSEYFFLLILLQVPFTMLWSTILNADVNQPSISSTFYARVFSTQVLFSSYVLAKKNPSYKKRACKMLMKSTPGVNFTNILLKAFTHADPKSAKRQPTH